MHLSRKQIILIVLVTLTWGVNWPVMKLGVTGYPPLTFRAICLWLGVPVLGLVLLLLKVPFHIQRRDWRELFWLAVTNMFVWHALIILAVSLLSSGRAMRQWGTWSATSRPRRYATTRRWWAAMKSRGRRLGPPWPRISPLWRRLCNERTAICAIPRINPCTVEARPTTC